MPNTRLDDADRERGRASPLANRIDFDLALVVGSSPINRVVVSGIAERAGLRVIAASPQEAPVALLSKWPGTVILDGGADDRDCDSLMESLAAQRLASGGRAPFVILLQNAGPERIRLQRGGTVDAIVPKPIRPDRLQPLIRSMIDRVRG
jgi:CheY-like chemotaxis protein